MSRPQTPRPLCKAATYIMPRCNLWFGFQTKILTRTNLAYTCPAIFSHMSHMSIYEGLSFWSLCPNNAHVHAVADLQVFFNSSNKDHKGWHGGRCRCTRASKRDCFAFFAPILNASTIHDGMQIKSTDDYQIWNSVVWSNILLQKKKRTRKNLLTEGWGEGEYQMEASPTSSASSTSSSSKPK